MPEQSRMHFYLNWAKERLDEMDATLASLEDRTAKMQADSRAKADRFIADLRKRRDEFRSAVKNQAEASDAAWDSIKVQLETEWKKFEAEVKKYLETFGKDIEQQKAIFRGQVAAQIKAWRDTADMIHQLQNHDYDCSSAEEPEAEPVSSPCLAPPVHRGAALFALARDKTPRHVDYFASVLI